MKMNTGIRQGLLVCGSSLAMLAALPNPARAQQAPGEGQPADAQSTAPKESEIVVTGSRITRRDYKSESPISTVDASAIKASGSPSLDGVLGQMPQFAAGQGASNSNPNVQGGGLSFAGGQSYSDLRGLGPNRSLVLLDGRRLMSSAPSGAIDLNEIPTALVDNVEVITGGASAAYGSDAVAGVVNFKLKKKFSGIELDVQHGATTRGDGATNQISGIIGGSFAEDRGHAMLAFGYSDRATVLGSSRSFFTDTRELARPPEGMINPGNYAGGKPTIAAVNAVLAGYSGTTPIAGSGTYNGSIGVNADGTIFTTKAAPNCVQNYRGLGTMTGINIGNGDLDSRCYKVQVALGQLFDVQVPLTKYNAFANADYELNEHITTYGQFNFMESSAIDRTGPGSSKESGSLTLQLPMSNPFVQGNAALMSILNSGTPASPTGTLRVTALLAPFGNRVETFKYDVWQALAGLKGDIPGTRLKWDVYGSLGHTQFTNNTAGDASISAITAMLNGTANYTGSAGTCKGYAWNPLGNHPLTAACLEYAGRTDHNVNVQTQKVVEATLEGPLFRLPGGDASFALGADYRETSFNYQPDNALITGDSLPFGSISAASGRQKVKEVFGELLLPLLSDRPFFKELSLDLGYRYSKYDTFSGKSTWKADASWAPVEQVRFRGGYSVAIRAPSLEDLYGPITNAQVSIGNTPNAGDPCDVASNFRTGANAAQVKTLCLAQGVPSALIDSYSYGSNSVQGTTGSNTTLTPEKANTWSIGAVISPEFNSSMFRNLQISVDYYNIKISNAIGSLNLTDILPRCFNSDGVSNPTYSSTNAYCLRIQRDASSGVITSSQQGLFNFATYTVSGIDTQFNWSFGLDALGASSKAGKIAFNSVVSYLKNYKVAGLFGSPTLNYAGSIGYDPGTGDISHPKWKANTGVTYSNGGFSGTLRWRYIGGMKHVDRVTNPSATTAGVSAYSYLDLEAHYKINEHFSLGAGLTNLTDKDPPYVSAAPLRTDSALYDTIGRTWYLSMKAKF
ncbi:MAG: TonB-dependent receptor [Sphingomonadales bacterium]|nr:TonB-dependent receptor [Sphingomonadales bacterium]